jgi:hypothetical protein
MRVVADSTWIAKVTPIDRRLLWSIQYSVVAPQASITATMPRVPLELPGLPAALMTARIQWIGRVALYAVRSVAGAVLVAGMADVVLTVAAGLVVAGAVALAIWDGRVFFATLAEAVSALRNLLETGDPGSALRGVRGSPPLIPTPPMPDQEPGFTPGRHTPAQIPGLEPAAPIAPPPGFTPHPRPKPVPPAAGPTGLRPMAVHQTGRPGDRLRIDSKRARAAVQSHDREVTDVLHGLEWRVHHLINSATIKLYHELFEAAARFGWRADEPGNLVALPADARAQAKLTRHKVKRPIHDSGHSRWNDGVRQDLESLRSRFGDKNLQAPKIGHEIRNELERIQNKLRHSLAVFDRLTEASGGNGFA